MKHTDHSFYVLAYHDSPFIEECIESLKKQRIRSEIYLSTSTPSEFLRHLSDKHTLQLLINSSSNGMASDWTFAYNSSTSDYVTLAHQDDIYLPEYTESCLNALKYHPDSLIAFSDYQELRGPHIKDFTLNILVKMIMLRSFFLFKSTVTNNSFKRLMLSLGNPISCPGVMYSKRNIGVLNFNNDLDINHDWDAWFNLAGQNGSFAYVKKRLFIHRVHEEAESMKGISDERRLREDKMMLEKVLPNFIYQIISAIYSLSRRGW